MSQLTEKPSLDFFINAGVYLLEPVSCQYVPAGKRFDMTDLIERMVSDGRCVVSFPIIEYWMDIGRHADFEQARRYMAGDNPEPITAGRAVCL